MATRKSRRQRILDPLLDQWGPEIESAFLASVDAIKSDTEFNRLVERIAAGDLAGALDAMHIDAAVFSPFVAQLNQAFSAGGNAGTASMPKRKPDGEKFVIRFDAADPDAERWLKDHSSNAVKEILDDQRAMVRTALSEAMAAGANPRVAALDLVGRYDKRAGKRTGGLIGLTEAQEKIVRNAASELASKDFSQYREYLNRKMRDKRFDKRVLKAIATETPLSADVQQKAISAYKDKALKLRGDTIGRTEAMATLHRGRYQSYAQAIKAGDVDAREVKRSWQTASDLRVRHSHQLMNGQTITFYAYYTTPSGAKLLHPGDPNGPAAEIINCRCTESIRIDFLSRLRKSGPGRGRRA